MGKRRKMTKAEQREMRKYRAEIRKRIRAQGPYRDLPPAVKDCIKRIRKQLSNFDTVLYFNHSDHFSNDVLLREAAEAIEWNGIRLYKEIKDAGIGYKDGVPYVLVPPTKKESAHA